MIAGIVNADFEAIISLSICDSEGKIYKTICKGQRLSATAQLDRWASRSVGGA
ncbi:hypothetical protein [Merismopedia glauca]|uniref:hypothetical protein n=1 Tax=Merismopedia glauca TaxID=292586 RepID=UPI001C63905C|nr:hypothetical protein [Merismopedia glauca]